MNIIWNFPLFMIIGSLFLSAISVLLSSRLSRMITEIWIASMIAMDVAVMAYTSVRGSFTYSMGEFPAPWGNEIRGGILEALVLLFFLGVILCSLFAGRPYLEMHIDDSKENLYFTLINLSAAAIAALVFTNDIFSGYVFLEILTLSSCGLLIIREVGKTTLAAVRYMVLNLFGSGLFLLGVILLYSMSGHLLMVPLHEALIKLAYDPSMTLSLSFAIGVLTLGLSIKSGLFPFYFWMPDTYGWATPTTASIMSSVVSKAYLFLLIKIYYRVIGPGVLERLPMHNILLVLGIGGMIIGSIAAMRENNINRMVALSSAAQIGYIFMSLGIGDPGAYVAAIFHMLGHSITKSLLFLTTPRLADTAGGSLVFHNMQGAALRNPAAGFFFVTSAFSMIGLPVFVGFSSKFLITLAAFESGSKIVFYSVMAALVASTVLNALYFMRTVIRIYARPEKGEEGVASDRRAEIVKVKEGPGYLIPAIILTCVNVFMGIFPMIIANMVERGLYMLM